MKRRALARREFLDRAFLAAAALAAPPAALAQEPAAPKRGPNDRIRVAVLGVHGQGMGHVRHLVKMPDADLACICDVDSAVGAKAVAEVEKTSGKKPAYVQDPRRVFDDKGIDAVVIATTNHWHALATIWAVQAGKDVYVEKPVSHNVTEGRRMIEAARRHGKLVQTGTQSRGQAGMQAAIEFLHSGKLGKLQVARGLCYKPRGTIGKTEGDQPVPATVDYDLWVGPAPMKPPRRKQFHYDWHWFWDYGNGDLGNQGIHQMDVARWGLNRNGLPRSVVSVGGRLGYEDDGETANTQIAFFDYGDAQLIFEVRGLSTPGFHHASIGNVFHCSDGMLVCTSYSTGVALDAKGETIETFKGGGDHMENFLAACRTRKTEDLDADIVEGHLSSALCHLGNISYRLGTPQVYDEKAKPLGDNAAAAETMGRLKEHLAAHKIELEKTPLRLGRALNVDAPRENFGKVEEANALLTREYRKPFVVPDKV